MAIYLQETCIQLDITNAMGVFIRTASGKLSRNFNDIGDLRPGRGLWYREWDPILKTYKSEINLNYDRFDNVRSIACPDIIPPTPQTQEAGVGWILGLGLAVGGIYYWLKKKKKR